MRESALKAQRREVRKTYGAEATALLEQAMLQLRAIRMVLERQTLEMTALGKRVSTLESTSLSR